MGKHLELPRLPSKNLYEREINEAPTKPTVNETAIIFEDNYVDGWGFPFEDRCVLTEEEKNNLQS